MKLQKKIFFIKFQPSKTFFYPLWNLKKKKKKTHTSISNLWLSFKSCSLCSSTRTLSIDQNHGLGGWKILLLPAGSKTLATNGTTNNSSACPFWNASMINDFKSISRWSMGRLLSGCLREWMIQDSWPSLFYQTR